MQISDEIRCAEALVKILEKEQVKFIFGHPGEQILPFYQSLKLSKIKHVLMRHEQGAAHAADGYARASAQPGVCVASAGPGALNLVMGVATAYKDSVPLLVITGDVSLELKGENVFQEIDINDVFKPITITSINVRDPEDGLKKIKEAFQSFKKKKTGPIHLNFPKDVLQEKVDAKIILELIGEKTEHVTKEYGPIVDSNTLKRVIGLIENSEKPLILAGAGVIWSNACKILQEFAEENQIPLATTYPARGVISEDHPLSLGMIGLRGTEAANFAGRNSDLILALGCRFSERTQKGLGNAPIIHVNIDEAVLSGNVNIRVDVKEFLAKIRKISTRNMSKISNENSSKALTENTKKWLQELKKYDKTHKIKTDFDETLLKPQRAIKEILDGMDDSILVNDAGSHTTWVTLLMKVLEPSSLIFSGGLGPMGYGIPAAIGVSLARPRKNVVVVVGDGGFQMTSQELATIAELDLPIIICLINNQSLGIIRQWQELYYDGPFQVKLANPDFVKLATAYHINAKKVSFPGDVSIAMENGLKLNKPLLIEIKVDENEDIPLPK